MNEGCQLIFSILTTFSFDFSSNTKLESGLKKSLPVIYEKISTQSFNNPDIYVLGDISKSVIDQDIFLLKRENETRLCFEVAFILMFQYIHKNIIDIQDDLTYDMMTMLEMYPDFSSLDEEEKKKLLLFRNAIKVAMLIIPAKSHKNHLLAIVTRMTEGREVKYVTGSGQTSKTTSRVVIYETEGNVTAKPRPPRKKNMNASESSSSKSFINDLRQSSKSRIPLEPYIVDLNDLKNMDSNCASATRLKRGLSNYSSCPQTNIRSLRSSGETDHEIDDNDENDYFELACALNDNNNVSCRSKSSIRGEKQISKSRISNFNNDVEDDFENDNLEWLCALTTSMTECQVSPIALNRTQSDASSVSANSIAEKTDKFLDLEILDFVASFSPLSP